MDATSIDRVRKNIESDECRRRIDSGRYSYSIRTAEQKLSTALQERNEPTADEIAMAFSYGNFSATSPSAAPNVSDFADDRPRLIPRKEYQLLQSYDRKRASNYVPDDSIPTTKVVDLRDLAFSRWIAMLADDDVESRTAASATILTHPDECFDLVCRTLSHDKPTARLAAVAILGELIDLSDKCCIIEA